MASETPSTENSLDPTSAMTFTNVPFIPCEKLTGSANYTTWAAIVKLWFHGQGHADHLTAKVTDIPNKDLALWRQIDTSLCNVLWYSIALNLQISYQAFDTGYEVWSKAKKVDSNDVHCLYSVITTMLSTKLENMHM